MRKESCKAMGYSDNELKDYRWFRVLKVLRYTSWILGSLALIIGFILDIAGGRNDWFGTMLFGGCGVGLVLIMIGVEKAVIYIMMGEE